MSAKQNKKVLAKSGLYIKDKEFYNLIRNKRKITLLGEEEA
jgi:hypothetical protein